MTKAIDSYHKWLGIPPAEQPPNHYRLLGIPLFETDREVISTAADQRILHLRTFQLGNQSALSEKLLGEVVEAQICLLNPAKKAEYDEKLRLSQTAARSFESTPTRPLISRPSPWLALVAVLLIAWIVLGVWGLMMIGGNTDERPTSPQMAKNVAPPAPTEFTAATPAAAPVLSTAKNTNPKPTALSATTPNEDTSATSTVLPPPKRLPPFQLPPSSKNTLEIPSVVVKENEENSPWPFDAAKARRRQSEAAKVVGHSVDYTNSIGMKFKLIPAGEFMMGSPNNERTRSVNEEQHRVRITKSYYIGVYEVTQGEFEKIMGMSPWKGKPYVQEGVNYPASYVSWNEAAEFCRRISIKERRTYRLPTEAEREYACRAGSATLYYFGNNPSILRNYAWYHNNAKRSSSPSPRVVGKKRPNAFGLFDMHGNVWEWCSDWYDGNYYANSPTIDPTGPISGSARVDRGGCWHSSVWHCRSALRNCAVPGRRHQSIGFRVALNPKERRK